MQQATVIAEIVLEEKELKDILIKHYMQNKDLHSQIGDGTVVIFKWFTSKWDPRDKICEITFANTTS